MYQSALDLSGPLPYCRKYAKVKCYIDYQTQLPWKHAKTILESLIIFCVHRPHDNGTAVSSDIIRKSHLCVHYSLPHVVGNTTKDQISALFETYQTELACNIYKFNQHVSWWQTRWINTSQVLQRRDLSVYYISWKHIYNQPWTTTGYHR